MDIHEYAKFLLEIREQGLSVSRLLGVKWIALKLLLVLVGVIALLCAHVIVKAFGVFVLGYVYGVAVADIRSQVSAKRRWPLLHQLLDWAMIESSADGESGSEQP